MFWHRLPCCSTSVSHAAGSGGGGGVAGGALYGAGVVGEGPPPWHHGSDWTPFGSPQTC